MHYATPLIAFFGALAASCSPDSDLGPHAPSSTSASASASSDDDSDASSATEANETDVPPDDDASSTTGMVPASTDGDPSCRPACEANEECVAGECFPLSGIESSGGDAPAEPASDPSYPNPALGCPPQTIDGSAVLTPRLNLCIPACDPTAAEIFAACPAAATGTAVGACWVGSPEPGSGAACSNLGFACDVAGEWCLNSDDPQCEARNGCILTCTSAGQVCPDGMTCDQGMCSYADTRSQANE